MSNQPDRRVSVRGHLTLPCCVNIREIDGPELDALLQAATDRIGAIYSESREAFDALVEDRRKAARRRKTLQGPFLRIGIRFDMTVGIRCVDTPAPEDAILDADQLLRQTRGLNPAKVDEAFDAAMPGERPRRPFASDWQTIREDGLQYSRETKTYWYKGEAYCEKRARHHGLVGLGALLRRQISSIPTHDEGPAP